MLFLSQLRQKNFLSVQQYTIGVSGVSSAPQSQHLIGYDISNVTFFNTLSLLLLLLVLLPVIKYLKAVSLFLKGLISGVDDVISPLISVLSKDLAKFACPKRRRYELLTTQEDLLIYISGDKATLGLTKLLSCVDLAGTILSIEK